MLSFARKLSPFRRSSLTYLPLSYPSASSASPATRRLPPARISPFSSQPAAGSQTLNPPPPPSPPPPPPFPLSSLRGGCYNVLVDCGAVSPPELPLCPGCGVHMQCSHPSLPGFFSTPSPNPATHRAAAAADRRPLAPDVSISLKSGLVGDGLTPDPAAAMADSEGSGTKPLVCARCHSLRHYGRVKCPAAENLLPDFDFDRMVAPRIASPSGPRSVVVMVADAADFDGSFPRKVARLVSASIDRHSGDWKEGKAANVPRVVLVVTKIDLLPTSVGPEELEGFARRRASAGGASKVTSVHMVSSLRGWGIRNLLEEIRDLAGPRGNVWVVGAQNAGKSTLINAMGKLALGKVTQLTEAPVPGTTLGILRMDGILGGKGKLFDTPGILHPYQITMRLTREEQKLVHMSKELRPRTYRIKAGHSVHIGGLLRLDVEELSVDTLYLTVWASPLIPLHMGKMENAATMIKGHFGRQLQPPIGGKERVGELGQWGRREFRVAGSSWEASSVDLAVAGLGWLAVGMKGEAVLGVWTYDGVDVVSRGSLIAKTARVFEEAGFTNSKVVSRADSASNKTKDKKMNNGGGGRKEPGSRSAATAPSSDAELNSPS